jgi:hypothetical protein
MRRCRTTRSTSSTISSERPGKTIVSRASPRPRRPSSTPARIHGDSNYVQLVGSRRLSDELGNLAEAVNLEGGHHLHFDYSMDAKRASAEYLLPERPLLLRPLRHPDHLLHHRRARRLSRADRRAAVHRLRPHDPGSAICGRSRRPPGKPRPSSGGGPAEAGAPWRLPAVMRATSGRARSRPRPPGAGPR